MRACLVTVAVSFVAMVSGCAGPPPQQAPTGCWEHRIEIPNTEGNLLTLCIAGDAAMGNIRFANLDGAPNVCKQAGVVKTAAGGGFTLALENGTCENGRAFAAAEFQCTRQSADAISCRNSTVTGPLLFLRR